MNPAAPSRTAIVVAKSQALVGMSPPGAFQVPPDTLRFVQTALRQTGNGRFVDRLRRPLFRRLVRIYESFMVPGLALHHALRKQIVERIVRRELTAGATQVVQIGAGFDALAHRLHREFPQASFIEFDHPATRLAKLRAIKALGGARENLRLHAVELAAPDATVRLPAPPRRTVIIIEGVLMYLEPERVRRILRLIGNQMTSASRLLFSFLEQPRFQRQSPAVAWWLRAGGEPFRWSLPREDLAPFLAPLGIAPLALHSTRDALDDPGHPVAEGELLCEARTAPP